MSHANLSGANLQEGYLKDANLREADLRNANLCSTYMKGVDLRGAKLRKVIVCEQNWFDILEGWKVKGLSTIREQYFLDELDEKNEAGETYYILKKRDE